MVHRLTVASFFLISLACCVLGCGSVDPPVGEVVALDLSQDEYSSGRLVLGSPSLTVGIPGAGPLTSSEVNLWLATPENHEPLNVTLPEHLLDQNSGQAESSLAPTNNKLTRAKIELGRQLFFDKRLSGYGTFSCATCHQPDQSYSSYQVMPEVGRNALPVVNRILGTEQFWDGRAENLEAQPVSPIKNPFEMNSTPEKSRENIAAIPGYRLQFEAIFGSVTFENICKALACFERTLVTSASAWDKQELSESAQRGEALFFSDRLSCGDCHTGANLTDEQYHNLGTHQLDDYDDQGRAKVTSLESDRYAFKTPSLRNVAETPPYMHNGVFRTLEEVIDFFDRGGEPLDSVNHPLETLSLTADEKQDLLEFLKSLSSSLPPVETARLPE